MYKVLVCGDRNWQDYKTIFSELTLIGLAHDGDITVIHGCANGADSLGGAAAHKLNFPVLRFPAEWDKYGKRAGILRNQQMLDEGKPDFVLAFHSDIANSKGTKDMIARADKAGIPVKLVENEQGDLDWLK